jgi:hypothetical protein
MGVNAVIGTCLMVGRRNMCLLVVTRWIPRLPKRPMFISRWADRLSIRSHHIVMLFCVLGTTRRR